MLRWLGNGQQRIRWQKWVRPPHRTDWIKIGIKILLLFLSFVLCNLIRRFDGKKCETIDGVAWREKAHTITVHFKWMHPLISYEPWRWRSPVRNMKFETLSARREAHRPLLIILFCAFLSSSFSNIHRPNLSSIYLLCFFSSSIHV